MKITDKVYALESTEGAYAYIVLGTEIVLIDTGFAWVGKKILKELKSMKIKLEDIKHIILTNHDLDHVGNVVLLNKHLNRLYVTGFISNFMLMAMFYILP